MVYGFLFTQLHLFPSNLFLSFLSPSLPSFPIMRHSMPIMWSWLTRELKDPPTLPLSLKQKQQPTPCTVSREQQPEPSTRTGTSCEIFERGSGRLLGGMGRVFLTSQNQTTAMLHFYNRRLKTHLNDRESQI